VSSVPVVPSPAERRALAAARRGDEAAYRALVEPLRRELHAHCYRMLGSIHDAEDAHQDALLRAWRSLGRFEGRSSLRSWLYRIHTNACLDVVARRKRRVLPADHGPAGSAVPGPGAPLAESIWIEPYPDERYVDGDGLAAPEARYEQREGVELAFVAALQHLPPRQRAVLILREVLGFSAREVAATLDTTVPAVNSALQRARATLDGLLPERSQQATLRSLGDAELRRIVETYVDAWQRGDVDGIVRMLAEDATLGMPPMPTWYRGEDLVIFLRDWAFSGRVYGAEGRRRVRALPTRANGQPAIGVYSWDDARGAHLPTVLQVLTLDGDRIVEIMGFVTPALFPHFGLPTELPA
jgi:RNA polymerase sigma-70 factor (ECF subfamily)